MLVMGTPQSSVLPTEIAYRLLWLRSCEIILLLMALS